MIDKEYLALLLSRQQIVMAYLGNEQYGQLRRWVTEENRTLLDQLVARLTDDQKLLIAQSTGRYFAAKTQVVRVINGVPREVYTGEDYAQIMKDEWQIISGLLTEALNKEE